jgi:hypothetical protein
MSTLQSSRLKAFTITHDVVNFSTAQQKYSFGKDSRFKQTVTTTPTDFNVTLPSTFDRRSPSFGIGDRFKGAVPKIKCKKKKEDFSGHTLTGQVHLKNMF